MTVPLILPTALCTSCDLHTKSKVNCMKGRGPAGAQMMFVGEAPGEEEECANQPFVGPSGDVFERLLMHAGLNRHQVFATSTVRCRPVDETVFRRDREGRVHYGNKTPTVQQSYVCAGTHLEPEIASVRPKVLVAMGNVVCDYLFGRYKLNPDGKVAVSPKTGKPLQIRRLPKISDLMWGEYWDQTRGCWIVPMYHPSFIVRMPEWFILMGELLKRVRQIAESGPGTERTQVQIATNFDDAIALLRQAAQHPLLAYDHETYSLDWRFGPMLNVGLSWAEGTGISIRLADNNGVSLYSPDQRRAIVDACRPIFQAREKVLVGYNVPFDSAWTEAANGLGLKVTAQVRDVQAIYHTLNSTATHKRQSLEMLTWLYTSMANYKEESKPWFDKKKFVECPIPVMSFRNGADCDATLRLHNRFWPRLRESPAAGHYDRLIKDLPVASTTLHVNGINIDLERLRGMERAGLAEAERLSHEFFRVANVAPFNLRSGPQLSKVLFEQLRLPVLEYTKTGKPSTSEYVLTELAKKAPALGPLMEYKKLQKLIGTYVLGLRGAVLYGNTRKKKPDLWSVPEANAAGFATDGRAHPSFSITGTVTGRPSVSNPNIANQPRVTDQQKRLGLIIRQSFAAPTGWWVLERDLSQAELRVLAAVSGDQALKDAVNSKEGVHKRTAAHFYGVDVLTVTDSQKSSAKTVVFAIVYGGTEYTVEEQIPEVLDAELRRRFAAQLLAQTNLGDPADVEAKAKQRDEYVPSKDERLALAVEWIQGWRAQYPKAGAWIDSVKAFVCSNGYVVSPFGRVFHFPLALSNNFQTKNECMRQAVNYCIQSTASDITFMAGVRIQNEIEARGYKTRWVNMVYDALAYEVPDNELEAMKLLTKQELERSVPELDINIVSDLSLGRCWKDENKYGEQAEVEIGEEVEEAEEEDDDDDQA